MEEILSRHRFVKQKFRFREAGRRTSMEQDRMKNAEFGIEILNAGSELSFENSTCSNKDCRDVNECCHKTCNCIVWG
jgi:hypothetical protein